MKAGSQCSEPAFLFKVSVDSNCYREEFLRQFDYTA